MLQHSSLEIPSENLRVSICHELAPNSIKHADDAIQATACSPAVPDLAMAVWTGDESPEFLGIAQGATVCNQKDASGIVPHESVRAEVRIVWKDQQLS